MIFAVATAFLFAGAAICGKQATERTGSLEANFYRLVLAVLALGLLTLVFYPDSFSGPTFFWLFASGLIGFGLGDVALYLAFARLGSRLTLLLNFSLATVFGILGDWIWLGDRISPRNLLFIALIMGGLALALMARRPQNLKRTGSFGAGMAAAVVAAFGQGFGTTVSRHALKIAESSSIEISGISQAFQRVVPGMLVGGIVLWYFVRRNPGLPRPALSRSAMSWIVLAAFFGPVAGVSCYQWALQDVPSGIVLAISSTAPLVIIPFSAAFEHDHPTTGSVLGAAIAIAGVAALCVGG